jgi:hypothetical protein
MRYGSAFARDFTRPPPMHRAEEYRFSIFALDIDSSRAYVL